MCVNTNTGCDKAAIAALKKKKKKSYWLTTDLSTPNKTTWCCRYTQLRNTPQKKQKQDSTQAACHCLLLTAGTSLHSQIPEAASPKPGLTLSPCIRSQASVVYKGRKSRHPHTTWEQDCAILHPSPDFYKAAFYSIYFVQYIWPLHTDHQGSCY